MSFTTLARPFFLLRQKQIHRFATEAETIQKRVLRHLVARSKDTEFGKRHHFTEIDSYESFKCNVPIGDYESHKADIDRMRHGEKDILWPGRVKWFAKSSGTTNDRSKFIPVSKEGLNGLHYKGGADAVALYLANRPDAKIFDGRALILGGSHAPNYNTPNSLVGDLSAILIENINPAVNFLRTPQKSIALLEDFEEKREKIANIALKQNIVSLSGVPSWMMSVIKRVMELGQTDNLTDIWPNLEVFWHGGVAFGPYRDQYKDMIRSSRMQYMETYNASEGFFGLQSDPDDQAMLLMLDYDCFYEFIATDDDSQTPIPLWETQVGTNYAMLITTSCGLWRYQLGDTIRFTQAEPYKFKISGRTKSFINAFGEELMVDNAEQALLEVCKYIGLKVKDYTAAPVFMDSEGKCRHQWIIEFAQPCNISDELRLLFTSKLDQELRQINSDYDAKRLHDLTLQAPELIFAPCGTFDLWLKNTGKLGGQHKVPRLCNDRHIIDQIIRLLEY